MEKIPVDKILEDYDVSKLIKPEISNLNDDISYNAIGNVFSVIFYLQFNVTCEGKTFTGKGGGISSPGGGAMFGNIYTSDLSLLFEKTVSFQFNCTPVYSSLLFFDDSSKLLGHFQSGSVSTILGTGGGSGSWS